MLVVRCGLLLTMVLVATTAFLPTHISAATVPHTSLYSLSVVLSVAPDLPQISTRAMTTEADRIWRREGVELRWPAPTNPGKSAPLRVMVYERREALGSGTDDRWTVAELVPQTGRRALAVASIAGAERVLLEARKSRARLIERPEPAEYRLGVVLGRAVAHEIGHFLLATATHADSGLMRAAIDAREFADPGARTFALDDVAAKWLRDRLSQIAEELVPLDVFTYTAQAAGSVTP